MRAPAAIAFVVVLLAAVQAHAAPAADVVVAWGPSPLGKLGDTIADAAARAGASYIDQSPQAQALPDPHPLIKRGIAAYAALEFEAATSALDAAAELVDQTGAVGVDTATLADLFLYRALAYSQRNDDTRSWDDFVIAAGIDPTRVLDPAGFPPRAVERFGNAKAHVAALPRGKLTLTGAGCQTRIDGAVVTSPEIELPFGRHWLDASCVGRAPVRRRVTVDRAAFELVLAGAPIAMPDDASLLIQARTAGARAMVVVTLQGRTIVIRRLGVLDGKEQDRVSIALGGANEARDTTVAVSRLLAPPKPVAAQPWYRSRWVWAAVGAVAASAILIPLAARNSGSTPDVVVRPQDVPTW